MLNTHFIIFDLVLQERLEKEEKLSKDLGQAATKLQSGATRQREGHSQRPQGPTYRKGNRQI